MGELKRPKVKNEKLAGTKVNGRVENRRVWVDGVQLTMKAYSLRNPEFGAFEALVPARGGVAVQPHLEIEMVNPCFLSIGRVNSTSRTNAAGQRETDHVAFIERSIIADSLKLKGEK
ncbi:hypothetical protein I6N96_12625 [Enterococcus sp. BWM-S5]|uniref:Single-stranded DNA-binding protein n=1 Tax=Enterococcus larvae TaxID=2794352 RepID=A0ABS4CKH7_9ENTE|nr:hypothetical protein [Enterococcus larvae]MBP1047118.1 hypothetical protein [Enterococcus larvae]